MSAVWAQDALTKGTNTTTTTADTDVIKILPTQFISDDDTGVAGARIENDGSNFGVKPGSGGNELFVFVDIPLGYIATKVKVYGSDTNNQIEVYTVNLDDGTIGDEISNSGLTVADDTALASNHVGKNNNALMLEVVTGTGDDIYGAYVTIQRG